LKPPVRALLFSTLYPSSEKPLHGVFVETRLRELLRCGGIEARVMAPVPWFPSSNRRFGEYARMARTPAREIQHGIDVMHPRYPLLPKVGMTLSPLLLALACVRPMRRLIRDGFDFDLIDAHYFYPDGVAAALLARWLGKPLLITARGSDVNLIAKHALPRRMIRWAAGRANAVIGVSAALVEVLAALGVQRSKLHVLRNGVDLERFTALPCDEMRRALKVEGGPVLLSVGNLVVNKGHDLVIDALALLLPSHPAIRLVVVGHGPELARLQAHADARGVAAHVTFAGAVANDQMAGWYSVADVLVLASSREGWPNVLLEAMACGTPVVATRVGGIPEIITGPHAGVLAQERSANGIAHALSRLLAAPATRAQVRRHAEGFGWGPTSREQASLFNSMRGSTGEVADA